MIVEGDDWAGDWTIDPAQSTATFTMNYLVVATLEGRFGAVTGSITIDNDDLTRSSVHAAIDARTIRTGNRLRDAHLRSGDFFDVERFPKVTFLSTRVEMLDGDRLRIHGGLTLRDVTEEVALDVTFEGQAADVAPRRARFSAHAILSRRAFGLGRRALERVGVVASDRVDVALRISAVAA